MAGGRDGSPPRLPSPLFSAAAAAARDGAAAQLAATVAAAAAAVAAARAAVVGNPPPSHATSVVAAARPPLPRAGVPPSAYDALPAARPPAVGAAPPMPERARRQRPRRSVSVPPRPARAAKSVAVRPRSPLAAAAAAAAAIAVEVDGAVALSAPPIDGGEEDDNNDSNDEGADEDGEETDEEPVDEPGDDADDIPWSAAVNPEAVWNPRKSGGTRGGGVGNPLAASVAGPSASPEGATGEGGWLSRTRRGSRSQSVGPSGEGSDGDSLPKTGGRPLSFSVRPPGGGGGSHDSHDESDPFFVSGGGCGEGGLRRGSRSPSPSAAAAAEASPYRPFPRGSPPTWAGDPRGVPPMPGVSLFPGGTEVPLQAVRPLPSFTLYTIMGSPWYRHPVTEREEASPGSYVPYRGDGPRAVEAMQSFAERLEEAAYEEARDDDSTSTAAGSDGDAVSTSDEWSSAEESDDPELPRLLRSPPVTNPAFFRLAARRRRAAMRAAVVAAATAVEAAAAAAATSAAGGRDADWAAAARWRAMPAGRCSGGGGGSDAPAAATLRAVAPAVAKALATTPAAAAAAARTVIRRSAAAARAAATAAVAEAVEALPLAAYDWPAERSADGWWRADPLARAYCRACGVFGCHRHHGVVASALPSAVIPDASRMGTGRTESPAWCTPCRLRRADAAAVAAAVAAQADVYGDWEVAAISAAADLVGTDPCRLALLLGPHICCGVVAVKVREWLRGGAGPGMPPPSPRYYNRVPPTVDEVSSDSDDGGSGRAVPRPGAPEGVPPVELTQRRLFVPCGHAGACTPDVCRCAAEGVPCEASCGCGRTRWAWAAPASGGGGAHSAPAGLCPRRVFCTCAPSTRRGGGAVCVHSGGASRCPCVAALRECDPDACGTCGAGLSVERRRERAALAGLPPSGGGGGGGGASFSPSLPTLRACANVAVQVGLRVPTVLGRSTVAGFGLFAAAPLRRHAFVGEYVGEVLDSKTASERDPLYVAVGTSYFFDFAASTVMDATAAGNKTRMINHKRHTPPLDVMVVSVRGDNHIAFMTSRAVQPGKELFFNYGDVYGDLLREQRRARRGLPARDGGGGCRPGGGRGVGGVWAKNQL